MKNQRSSSSEIEKDSENSGRKIKEEDHEVLSSLIP